jgi:SUMO ligase MMS21 Smc5/6 complex component
MYNDRAGGIMKLKKYIVIDYQKKAGKKPVMHSFGIVEAENAYKAKIKYASKINKKECETVRFTTIEPDDVGFVSLWDLKTPN